MKRGGLLLFLAWAGLPLFAHDPGLSSVEIELGPRGSAAVITLAAAGVTGTGADFASPLAASLARGLAIEFDGRAVEPLESSVERDAGNVRVVLRLAGAPAARLSVRSLLFERLPPGHRQYVAVRSAGGRVAGESMLSLRSNRFETAVAVPAVRRWSHFVLLGVEHIGLGYDHLVFLFGLLVAGSGLRSALKIITSFTVAHSITLSVAALGAIAISPRVVEPLIAVSIVYVGLENLLHRNLERRWLVTFAFGLVHGLGFASALADLGIRGQVLPLASFNIGVELGQVAIALVVLPLVWHFRRYPSFTVRAVPALSAIVAACGAVWLVERVLI
jgi:hydrogenase/urease accessory protein HupE